MHAVPGVPAALSSRRFEVLVFDWDGTAVPDRRSDATAARTVIEQLCARGADIVVVSGTNVGNVDGQLAARPSGPGGLYMALNRGSEVFAVGPEGPEVIERREATPREDTALSEIAARLQDHLADRGLHTEVISNRLNRRKIDLIPLPEWADPPKARIADLLDATERRLRQAGIAGLAEAIGLAEEVIDEVGLKDARLTSDVKHIEVGLTDKSDSLRWVASRLVEARGRTPAEVLVGGDEFGPIGGMEGSDFRMLVPEMAGATVVSVGNEPNGVPEGVQHLGGGPALFLRILEAQARLREPPQ